MITGQMNHVLAIWYNNPPSTAARRLRNNPRPRRSSRPRSSRGCRLWTLRSSTPFFLNKRCSASSNRDTSSLSRWVFTLDWRNCRSRALIDLVARHDSMYNVGFPRDLSAAWIRFRSPSVVLYFTPPAFFGQACGDEIVVFAVPCFWIVKRRRNSLDSERHSSVYPSILACMTILLLLYIVTALLSWVESPTNFVHPFFKFQGKGSNSSDIEVSRHL